MSSAGGLLRRTLDERSPSRRFDAKALQKEIEELERAVAPLKLITAVKRHGPVMEVAVMAASPTRKTKNTSPGATATGSSVSAWRPNPW